ncbi:ABC transporter permease subunit [bacterium]|nr:ABC transporter permease subunit [bacterium]MDY3021836.1 ABC transporter permease subunit [Oliverpabstia sp.]
MANKVKAVPAKKKSKLKSSNWQFWAIIALPVIYAIVFAYIPMGGIIIAFKDYSIRKGILGSSWVGLKYFKQFLTSPNSVLVIKNTFILGIYTLLANFPIPVLLAIAINEIGNRRFKKTMQMVTYAPYFISVVVLVGMMMQMMDLRSGIINVLLQKIGINPINFFGDAGIFRHLYVWSGVWQTAGYSSIIYVAALAGVSPELQEAAIVDGASRVQRILHVDIPAIMPTVIIMLIFNCSNIVSIGMDKIYLMQNSLNTSVSEVISTFVYKVGVVNSNFGFSTAAGLFQSVVAFALLVIVNQICKKITETSLW